ncbi:MAG: proline--tRNA ligase [Candidatus Bathyarchaeota archaeon]|nr:proline--tRNA ligase [Candidatus Bathyarchaeota archaeon]MDH5687618.1 proline--tRNA ligase [Candidatus Bathyarchaeota archaeon]
MMKKKENFSEWFDEVLFNADVVDSRYPVKGFAVYKGWGSKIVRGITEMLEKELEATGHDPMLFPVVIPEESFAKEAEHIKGFHAEVFWITRAGDRKLKRSMLLRPTSETAIYPLFTYWIRSHADLPLKMHQSVCVYRYETKATRPLLRMREFLWNEAHTAHADWEDAEREVHEVVGIYNRVYKSLGLSYLTLKRPDFDKFAGADYSLAFDAWNPDGRVNQIGTAHNLGENFSKAFELTYEDVDGSHKNVLTTCHGFGISRTLAAITAQHGDDHGLVLPPEIAPIQVVVVPIPYKEVDAEVMEYAKQVYEEIRNAGIRVHLDDDEKMQPGEKFYHWEMYGVPVRAEVGPKDLKDRSVTLSERDNLERTKVSFSNLISGIDELFRKIIVNISRNSQAELENSIVEATTMSGLKRAVRNRKIARTSWCGGIACAEKIKEESGGEIRGHRFDLDEEPENPCPVCDGRPEKVIYVARAY